MVSKALEQELKGVKSKALLPIQCRAPASTAKDILYFDAARVFPGTASASVASSREIESTKDTACEETDVCDTHESDEVEWVSSRDSCDDDD